MGNHLSSQSGLPLIRKPRQRDDRGKKREHVGVIICFLHPLSVCWREGGREGETIGRQMLARPPSFIPSYLEQCSS